MSEQDDEVPTPFEGLANLDLREVRLDDIQKHWLGMQIIEAKLTIVEMVAVYKLDPDLLQHYADCVEEGKEESTGTGINWYPHPAEITFLNKLMHEQGRTVDDLSDDEMQTLIVTARAARESGLLDEVEEG
tara:strand:- start:1259 stop:1651 length:393 start_codon:yes stop_codon:yes gene_type:complete